MIPMRPEPDGRPLPALPRHVLITRGRGRLARLAASKVTRSLETAGVRCTRFAPEHTADLTLDPRADIVVRSTEMIIAVGDTVEAP